MAIIQPPLPYAEDALEPHISAETLKYHYGKHHKTYVDKVNGMVKDKDLDDKTVEELVAHADKKGDKGLFNNAAQAWNHAFYWECLTGDKTKPSDDLAKAIDAAFGSFDDMKKKIVEESVAHFGSGWVWLVADDKGALSLSSLHDADTPLTKGGKALLTVDVWEHAYYIDKRNDRKAYAEALIDSLANWDFASENYARDGQWPHPTA